MPWEAALDQFLQRASCGFLDYLALGLTYLGDEIFFLVAALVLYWCIDKRFAYRFISVYIGGVSVCEGLKNLIARPRPFNAYPDRVTSIGPKTHGYSMPSGHSQSISNLATQVNLQYRDMRARKVLLPVGIGVTVVVMFTRLYLGQHYLTDVLTGLAVGVASAFAFTRLFGLLKDKEEWLFVGVLPITVIAMIVIVCTGSAERLPDVVKVLGGYGAVTLGYFLEKRFVRYDVHSGAWWKYLVKMLLGLAVVLALKEGLKYAFGSCGIFWSGYVRYFLVGMAAALGCPYLFKILRL